MRKLFMVFASLLAMCGFVYTSFSTYSNASNKFHKYEYYYNNSVSKENLNMTTYNKDKITKPKIDHVISLPTEINTIPSSTTVLINKEYVLPSDYIPVNLVIPNILFENDRYEEKKLMRADAATALEDLFLESKKAGLNLCGISGYRSFKRQTTIYANNIRKNGFAYTSMVSAKPGSSEHQSGLSIDISTASINNCLEEKFADTNEGKWLASNSHKYGFIIRYPKGKSDITGYSYEPWHIRYVGKRIATYLYDNSLTLEEYYNYTPSADFMEDQNYGNVVDIDQSTYVAKTPTPSVATPSPTIKPTATPTVTPTPTATPTATPAATPAPTPVIETTDPIETDPEPLPSVTDPEVSSDDKSITKVTN